MELQIECIQSFATFPSLDRKTPGLPDGIFSHQKSRFWVYFGMKNAGIVYGRWDYFTVIWDIYGHLVTLWSFGIYYPILVHCTKKNLATLYRTRKAT
jgi:hypothetical protein